MVRLTVVMVASPRKAHHLMEGIRSLVAMTRLENGCIGCSLWSDPDSTVYYYEEWETEAGIRRRIQSESFTSLLSIMESAREPPNIRFDFLTTTRGLDYVEEIRRGP